MAAVRSAKSIILSRVWRVEMVKRHRHGSPRRRFSISNAKRMVCVRVPDVSFKWKRGAAPARGAGGTFENANRV